MDDRPIGIFDSGLGGLTALRALRERLPGEDILYFGDTGRLPYGGRSREELRRIAAQDLALVAELGAKAVLVACGTISSNVPELIESSALPALGVLAPGVAAMARLPGRGPLAVIATQASIRSGAYHEALVRACPGREILSVACPDFVPLIESGHVSPADEALAEAAARYLGPLAAAGVEGLLLGCTHYGLIRGAIAAVLGEQVPQVEAAAAAAESLAALLRERGLLASGRRTGRERYITSGDAGDFGRMAAAFLGREAEAEHVPPMAL